LPKALTEWPRIAEDREEPYNAAVSWFKYDDRGD